MIIGTQTLDTLLILATDVDPSTAGGIAAPIGSFGSASDGSGFFIKSGALDTDWGKVVTTTSLLTTPLTGFVVGANSTITALDTVLSAFGKTQGQINPLVAASHPAVSISGIPNGLSIVAATQVLSLALSSTSTIGALSNTDWNTFNGKQNALGYTPVNRAGDTMTGFLVLNADAVSALGAVTLQQLQAAVVGVYDLQQGYDASTNLFPTAANTSPLVATILKGFIWNITVAGTLGGVAVTPGDTVLALVDSPGQTASNWLIQEFNLGYTPLSNVLNSANIFVGNGSNVATGVALSGDATISNTGVLTLGTVSATKGGTGQTVYVVGDILFASTTTALSKLSDIATGNALISGGVGVAPSYGKIGLTTHISGVLGTANGGTGIANNVASTLTISGSFASTFTITGAFNYTFPTASATLLSNSLGLSGGTILIGGTATTDVLRLRSTSGVGAAGANIIFQVGNNGATEAMRILNSGLIGFGVTAPTTFGDFAASVAANASMRIIAGTAPTAANQNIGDFWNDSTQKAISINVHGASSIVQNIQTAIFTQTANQNVANTTTETTLLGTGIGSKTLPANFFTAGKTIRLTLRGFFSRTSGNITIRFKLGATTVCATATASSGAGATDGFIVTIDCTCRTTGAGGTVFAQGHYLNLNNGTILEMVTSATVAVDTTASKVFDTTIQFSIAALANTFTSTNCTIEVLN